MSARVTFATARRVLHQLRHDRRTLAMLLLVPCILISLLAWLFSDSPEVFDRIGPALLGIFPFITMFLVTSVATLRERTSGTLERLLTMPMHKLDLLIGYALAFGVIAMLQALLAAGLALWVLGLDVAGPAWAIVLVAVDDHLARATRQTGNALPEHCTACDVDHGVRLPFATRRGDDPTKRGPNIFATVASTGSRDRTLHCTPIPAAGTLVT